MIYAVTNRKLVSGEEAYFEQIERIAAAKPDGIILREKDMLPAAYAVYAERCRDICDVYGVPLIIHYFPEAGERLSIPRLHLSVPKFKEWLEAQDKRGIHGPGEKRNVRNDSEVQISVSVHSREEAVWAENAGASYLVAGHIFPTDCKAGVPARGLGFLSEVCDAVKIPVFAIGGIDEENGEKALSAGAAGICLMSGLMKSAEPEKIIRRFSGRS